MVIRIKQLSKKEFYKIKNLAAKMYTFEAKLDKLLKTNKKTLKASFRRQKKDFLKHSGALFTAIDNSKIIGYTYGIIDKRFYNKESVGQIWELFVEEKYRNKGIGRDLIKCLLAWFKKQNLHYAGIGAYNSNPAAKLYKRLGFKEERTSFMQRLE